MEMSSFIKNPLIFGVLVGLLSLILLFLKEKMTVKDDKLKSSYLTYIQLFFASALPSGALAFLLYNRNVNFSHKQKPVLEEISIDGGSSLENELPKQPVNINTKSMRKSKIINTDIPNY